VWQKEWWTGENWTLDTGIVSPVLGSAVVVVGWILDLVVVLNRQLHGKIVRIQWIERHDIAGVDRVVPSGDRRRRSQRSELIANGTDRKRRARSHEQGNLQRAWIGAQDVVSDDAAQRVADHVGKTWYSLDMSRPTLDAYKIVLYRQVDGSWVAEVPAISGCYALMPTREEALAELGHVFGMIAEEYHERGAPLPEDTTEIVNA
jgi:predicted RNase H-like HicB family nuclease